MMNSKPFSGTNVFMSRKLVPPELFDTLLDALKQNGAEVFLCCDPSRSEPSDFHVISSPEHEKFEDLRAKGCQMIGPQCVLSCAKERRALPMQGFTCCLAMDGVKILASGFEANEKEKITKLVTAMRGTVHIKASSDVNFVVAKNVLATKYKWALNISKKPIVSIDWIDQCWKEHRVVPQEQHKILPFSGLMICVTGIPSGERKSMEHLILQNAIASFEMYILDSQHAPDGDKYKVARRWGHIYIVTRKWFDQSIARRACLNEESYPVQGAPVSSINAARASFSSQRSQDTTKKTSQSAFSSAVADSNQQAFPYSDLRDQDLEATLSQKVSFKVPDYSDFLKEDNGKPSEHPISELQVDGCVADDSQSEDNDLYLSECRIFLAGFGAPEMRKLVNTVRGGGGSRYMAINNGLTHIVIGDPSEIEKKRIRNLTASGVIKVVKANWLEDCDRLKKEIPVLQKHIGHDLLLPRGSLAGNNVFRQLNSSKTSNIPAEQNQNKSRPSSVTSFETRKRGSFETTRSDHNPFESTATADSHVSSANEDKVLQKVVLDASNQSQQVNSISTVFKGKRFSFSCSFPEERRAEIVRWISQGGGVMIDDKTEKSADFTIECHGVIPKSSIATRTTFVTSHWVRCCWQDGQLLDVRSHILYSPLPCGVPLPDFKSIRFCTSQYDEKDRFLLKNLFFTLGARYSEKLTKKVTHLVCKFTNGAKYEAACRWGIQTVTLEWIHECVQKNRVVPVDSFCPKEASTQELEAAKCSVSQYPTQAFQMLSGENPSQCTSQLRDNAKTPSSQATTSASDHFSEEQVHLCKRARSSEDCGQNRLVSCPVQHKNSTDKDPITENETLQSACNVSHGTPEIADAIEVFLEETSKQIHEVRSPERTKFDENQFLSECQVIDQQQQQAKLSSVFGLSNQLRNSNERNDDLGHSFNSSLSVPAKDDPLGNISGEVNANIYDGFSETQTESQIVGYEEDLSGRQMIIDRILARSSLT
ncbi:unnamed protein product [Rhodiola kirilowii]